MGAKVYLHIGVPKTGTTYLQDRLFLNRTELARHGVKYPVGARESMFFPAIDLTGIKWPGFHEKARGEWDALVRRTRLASGTVVISHEILAAAPPERIARLADDFAGAEVHVVISARDVARQLAADWQEGLKMYGTKTFGRYLDEVVAEDPATSRRWFWRAQHLPRVLGNWAGIAPPERTHLLVLPRSGADLWSSFCGLIGAFPDWAPRESPRRNPSLGRAEATLLRKLNKRLREAGVGRADYRRAVLNPIVYDVLSTRSGREPVVIPPRLHGWADDLAQQWAGEITRSGIDVVGDLADLRPKPPAGEWLDPDHPRPGKVNAAAVDALAGAVAAFCALPDPSSRLDRRAARALLRLARRPAGRPD
ncbi:hypothetical protein [Nocardioides sp.]|uniref:hypothetical protein n=1 Tax=Nocardioides sp. TaxID=35761 RepID=UPI0039E69162